MKQKRNVVLAVLSVLAILCFALFVRMNTFWLPHWKGDQGQYLGLAMKLDIFGFSRYNLRGINFGFVDIGPDKKIKVGFVAPADNPDDTGDLLRILHMTGVHYYDQPFFHKPPGFPYALMVSHKLFARKGQPYAAVVTNIGRFIGKIKPRVLLDAQFYAVIVPLFFSLGLVLCTFFLGKILFSARIGLYAALMMAVNPVAVMTSQYLLADDMLSFFVTLSAILFITGIKRKQDWFILFGGVVCGMAVLVKQTGGYLLIAVWIFSVLSHTKKLSDVKSLPRIVFNKRFILFSAGVFLVSGFWFIKIYRIYGHPLWLPEQPVALQNEVRGWSAMLRARPPGWILYLTGAPYLCPLFAAVFLSLKDFVSEAANMIKKKACDYRVVLLWIVILTFGYMLRGGREHRRMLAVYPAVAVLAGYCLDRFRIYSGRFSGLLGNKRFRELVILMLFAVCALWSVPIGVKVALDNRMLLTVPF